MPQQLNAIDHTHGCRERKSARGVPVHGRCVQGDA